MRDAEKAAVNKATTMLIHGNCVLGETGAAGRRPSMWGTIKGRKKTRREWENCLSFLNNLEDARKVLHYKGFTLKTDFLYLALALSNPYSDVLVWFVGFCFLGERF